MQLLSNDCPDNTPDDRHFRNSSHREFILEVTFLGELLRRLWCTEATGVQVLYPARDDAGYDLAVEANGILRYIQLKGTTQRKNVRIHRSLTGRRGSCVVGMVFDKDSLELRHFHWFGGTPSECIDASEMQTAYALRKNASGVRPVLPDVLILPSRLFSTSVKIEELTEKLFPKVDEV